MITDPLNDVKILTNVIAKQDEEIKRLRQALRLHELDVQRLKEIINRRKIQ